MDGWNCHLLKMTTYNQISKTETTLLQYHLKAFVFLVDQITFNINSNIIICLIPTLLECAKRWEKPAARRCYKLQCNAKCFKINFDHTVYSQLVCYNDPDQTKSSHTLCERTLLQICVFWYD